MGDTRTILDSHIRTVACVETARHSLFCICYVSFGLFAGSGGSACPQVYLKEHETPEIMLLHSTCAQGLGVLPFTIFNVCCPHIQHSTSLASSSLEQIFSIDFLQRVSWSFARRSVFFIMYFMEYCAANDWL